MSPVAAVLGSAKRLLPQVLLHPGVRCLRVNNVPWTCSRDDISLFFSSFGVERNHCFLSQRIGKENPLLYKAWQESFAVHVLEILRSIAQSEGRRGERIGKE